jgi:hypothetical protein
MRHRLVRVFLVGVSTLSELSSQQPKIILTPGLDKPNAAILPIQVRSRCDSLAFLFCGRKRVATPGQTKSMICFMLMALLAGCVEMVVPGQLDALKSGPIQPIGDY